jgi:hypothetical protein
MVLRQITLIKFKTGVSDQQIKELSVGFSKIANVVNGILQFDFGPDKNLEDTSMDYALVIDFDSQDSWKEYRSHPEHVSFAKNAMRIIERVERAQYDVNAKP